SFSPGPGDPDDLSRQRRLRQGRLDLPGPDDRELVVPVVRRLHAAGTVAAARGAPARLNSVQLSFFTITWLRRSQLYLRLRASGSQSAPTCTKPRLTNQCMVRVVSTKML